MSMKTNPTQPQDPQVCNTNGNCSTGGCGGPGLCPSIALLIAYLVGSVTTLFTGLAWLGWAIGISTALILLTGAWRLLPNRKESQLDFSEKE